MSNRSSPARALLCSAMLGVCLIAGMGGPALAGGDPPHVKGGSAVQRGAYLVAIGGCNDCHTPGWMEHPGEIPVAQRLTGSTLGWHGPWGTSFAANLRVVVAGMSEKAWLQLIASFNPLPPMPAYNVKSMSKSDQVAIFAYIKSLGPAGKPAPTAMPPGPPPAPPYFSLNLPPPPAKQ